MTRQTFEPPNDPDADWRDPRALLRRVLGYYPEPPSRGLMADVEMCLAEPLQDGGEREDDREWTLRWDHRQLKHYVDGPRDGRQMEGLVVVPKRRHPHQDVEPGTAWMEDVARLREAEAEVERLQRRVRELEDDQR